MAAPAPHIITEKEVKCAIQGALKAAPLKNARIFDIITGIANVVPIREIKAGVCEMLLERQWKNWTTADGETRRCWRPEVRNLKEATG